MRHRRKRGAASRSARSSRSRQPSPARSWSTTIASKIASATGGVLLKQEKRSANAKKLIYDDKKELLTLLGDIKGVDEDGQTFSAPDKVTICIKKGAEWMEAPNASATFKVKTEEDEGEKPK